MADISKCNNKKCKLSKTCYRFNAPNGVWQFYMNYRPDKDGKCKGYWAMENTIDKTNDNRKK